MGNFFFLFVWNILEKISFEIMKLLYKKKSPFKKKEDCLYSYIHISHGNPVIWLNADKYDIFIWTSTKYELIRKSVQ